MNIQTQNTFIVHSEQPFYSYDNGTYNRAVGSFEYTQDYTRNAANPLTSFMSDTIDLFEEFIFNYFNSYGIVYNGIIEIDNLRRELIVIVNNFVSEFENNMNIINNTYDAYGNPVYSGGNTTAEFTLYTTAAINRKTISQRNKKNVIVYTTNYYNPQFIYKFNIISINSQRW